MIVVTGGAFQGKSDWIKKTYQSAISAEADGAHASIEELLHADVIWQFHSYIRRRLFEGADEATLLKETESLAQHNPNVVIELAEIGSGIVPMQKEERIYRETVGRAGCVLAVHADSVYRVICGIAVPIKECAGEKENRSK
jgi:adenosyl cobinamide kinase/adenosyl cobinamide phosphate guanylyltransferase